MAGRVITLGRYLRTTTSKHALKFRHPVFGGGGGGGGDPTPDPPPPNPDDTTVPAPVDLLARLEIRNESGSESPEYAVYSFAHVFKKGEVPAGSTVVPRFEHNIPIVAWQIDRESWQHTDGSMNRAVFTIVLPEMPDYNAELAANPGLSDEENMGRIMVQLWKADGAKPGPNSAITSQYLLDHDFSVELHQPATSLPRVVNWDNGPKIAYWSSDVTHLNPNYRYDPATYPGDDYVFPEETWTASLNDAFATSDNIRVTRDGPIQKRWILYSKMRRASDGQESATLWVRWYCGVSYNGYGYQSFVHPQVCNGWKDAVGQEQAIDNWYFKRGGVTVWTRSGATPREDMYNDVHPNVDLFWIASKVHITDDGEPFTFKEDGSRVLPQLHHKYDRGYFCEAKALLPYAWTHENVQDYVPDITYGARAVQPGSIKYSESDGQPFAPRLNPALEGAGGGAYIGPLPEWSSAAIHKMTRGHWQNDKLGAFIWSAFRDSLVQHPGDHWPVVDSVGPFADLGGAANNYAGYLQFKDWTSKSATHPHIYQDTAQHASGGTGAHQPNPALSQMLYSGEEWFEDIQVDNCLTPKQKDPSWFNQQRMTAWTFLHLQETYFLLPEDHTFRTSGYLQAFYDLQWAELDAKLDEWYARWPSPIKYMGGLGGNDNGLAIWQGGWAMTAFLKGYWQSGNPVAWRCIDTFGRTYYFGHGYEPEAIAGTVPGSLYHWNAYYVSNSQMDPATGIVTDPDPATGRSPRAQNYDELHLWPSGDRYIEPGRPSGFDLTSTNQYFHDVEAYAVKGGFLATNWYKYVFDNDPDVNDAQISMMVDWISAQFDLHIASADNRIVWDDSLAETNSFAKSPKWATWRAAPRDYPLDGIVDMTAKRLTDAGAAEGQWIGPINVNGYRSIHSGGGHNGSGGYSDGSPHPLYNWSKDPDYKVFGQGGTATSLAYSCGVLVPERNHYVVLAGGGHNNYLGSEVDAFDFTTLRWFKCDDSCRYLKHIDPVNVPDHAGLTETFPYPDAPWQLEFDSFYDNGGTLVANPRNWPYPNVWGRWVGWATHTYAGVCYAPELGRLYAMGSARYPESGTIAGYYVVDASSYRWKNDEAKAQVNSRGNNQQFEAIGNGLLWRRNGTRDSYTIDPATGAETQTTTNNPAVNQVCGVTVPDRANPSTDVMHISISQYNAVVEYPGLRAATGGPAVNIPVENLNMPQELQDLAGTRMTMVALCNYADRRPEFTDSKTVVIFFAMLNVSDAPIRAYTYNYETRVFGSEVNFTDAPLLQKGAAQDQWRLVGYNPSNDVFYLIMNGSTQTDGVNSVGDFYICKRPSTLV